LFIAKNKNLSYSGRRGLIDNGLFYPESE